MGETRDWLEEHGGPGRILCGRTGTFIIDTSMCEDCPRLLCRQAQPGSAECDECRAACPDWTPPLTADLLGRVFKQKG